MTYTKRCPYCLNYIAGGHGDPKQTIGTPIKHCPKCGNRFVDSDVVEWAISPTSRKISFYLANNRWVLCFFLALLISVWGAKVFEAYDLNGSLPFALIFPMVFLLCAWFCSKYVKAEYAKQIHLSEERCKDDEYVQFLVCSGYPVDEQYRQVHSQSSEDSPSTDNEDMKL